jgi:PelA/Pel-15E family pectate lyase
LLSFAVLLLTSCASAAFADALTPDRVAALPAGDRPAWHAYLERSRAAAAKDEAGLRAELAASGMTVAMRAPSGGDFKLPAKPGDAWYAGPEASQLADVVLSYQAPSGGWSRHTGYAKGPRKAGTQWSSQYEPGQPPHYLATFDNRATTEEMTFLAQVWHATRREDCKAALVKGLNFILDAQYPNGGWPQVYPIEGKYHDDVTFNDDAMTRVLRLLQDVSAGDDPAFAFADAGLKARVKDALGAGVDCVLKTQIEIGGRKTAWCAQYDALTLLPSNARAMEPATLSGVESAHVLEFLMSVRNPSPEVVRAVEDGLAWLESAKITGIARAKGDNGKTTYVPDASSSEVYWARFYDLKTGKPVFPGRDGVLYESFQAMAANNRVGYDYYSTQPGSLLNSQQKKWRKTVNRDTGFQPVRTVPN